MARKSLLFGILASVVASTATIRAAEQQQDDKIKAAASSDVKVTDGFWQSRIETNRDVTIGYALGKCEETGRIDNFAIAGGLKKGKHRGHYFNDSDVFKVIEGAAYSLSIYPDANLEKRIDEIIEKIAAAQEDDGYLYTARTIDPDNVPEHSGKQRWSKLRYSHELYNLGHLYEAAVAYYQVTGKRNLLDVAIKSADLLDRTFGPDKKRDVSGHEEIEIGLVKLFEATGDRKYLNLAKFFVDERGHYSGRESYKDFRQDHKPFVEQAEAVGHAVSGGYFYAGIADLAAIGGNRDYVKALDRIWQDVVSKKLYITGVAAARGEKFGRAYQLPNLKGYNETCAAIALAIWNHRMFLLDGDAKYIDIVERALYNGILAGVSLRGDEFFYSNPLAANGKHKFNGIDVPDDQLTASRLPWFLCACCPSNIVRVVPSVPGYAYATSGGKIYVNLYMAGVAKVRLDDKTVELKQQTRYPWDGAIRITISLERPLEFSIYLRIPGWARNEPVGSDLYRYMNFSDEQAALRVNGKAIALDMNKGFARIKRQWEEGDVIELYLPMPVRRVVCNDKVETNRGMVALERGPIVYCAEWPDNGGKVGHLFVSNEDNFRTKHLSDLLGGISVILSSRGVKAIPYYAWAHRGEGEMKVWLPRELSEEFTAGYILRTSSFKHYIDSFNENDNELYVNHIPNSSVWEWLRQSIPLLECPDKEIERTYYFRWWTYRKHIKKTKVGFVVDEFLPNVGWGGPYNTISCAAGHHFYEGRWLHKGRYLDDYAKFWLRGGGAARRYSFWIADSYYARHMVHPNKKLLTQLLDDLIANYEEWEKTHLLGDGMFWQHDVADGMEESVSGSRRLKHTRPTINSYMYAEARAIARIATLADRDRTVREYGDKAARLKSLVQNKLWDEDTQFFKVRLSNGKLSDARESIGFVPWYFNLPDEGYERAWGQLMDPKGFYAPFGPTTAEQRHPGFAILYKGDDCQWNGPSWPFSTSQVLTALANVLNDYEQDVITKADYFETLKIYTKSHSLKFEDGRVLPWIDENLNPFTGQWLARSRKIKRKNFHERGKDYNHSTYCDLIISGLMGMRPRIDELVEVNPLTPDDWDWFCLDKILYHGRIITIVWDRTGLKYGKGKGLRIYANGKEIAQSNSLESVTGELP